MGKLNARQKKFVAEYLVDLNATQAALRAGYSPKTAEAQGCRLLKNVKVSALLSEKQQKRAEKAEITAELVLQQLARLGFSDVRKIFTPAGNLKSINDLPDDIASAVVGVDVVTRGGGVDENGERVVEYIHKIRLADKVKPLELVGKHIGMWLEKNAGKADIAEVLSKLADKLPGA